MMFRTLVQEPIRVWGMPFSPLTMGQTIEAVVELVEQGRPAFFITANTHYAMLTHQAPELAQVNAQAAFIVADGKPLVWASRRLPVALPERVAGSDLIFRLSALSASRGYRLYFAGGAPGVGEAAAQRLTSLYPGLQIVGVEAPSFRDLAADADAEAYRALKDRIREARPHILILAATQPAGEKWLAAHIADLGIPVGVNLGASIDFAAGRFRRAPLWMQRSGLEWAFRLWLEPRRLLPRYTRNAWFIARMMARRA